MPVAATMGPATDESVGSAMQLTFAEESAERVRAWARAWSEQRVEDYLSFYSESMRPPGGATRKEWEAGRRARLTGPKFIDVGVEFLSARLCGPLDAEIRFRQSYVASHYRDEVVKVLEMIRESDGWRIAAEVVEQSHSEQSAGQVGDRWQRCEGGRDPVLYRWQDGWRGVVEGAEKTRRSASVEAPVETGRPAEPERVGEPTDEEPIEESAVAEASPPPQPEPRADQPAEAATTAELAEAAGYPSLKIFVFSDFTYDSAEDREGNVSSEGHLALHLTSALTPRVSFFGEVTVTAGGHDQSEANLERAILRHEWSDAVQLSGGRFHTPISWWNTAYHHGFWLQTTIDRPKLSEFGGGFLPNHFEGALFEGTIPLGGWSMSYGAGLGNGRSVDNADGAHAPRFSDSTVRLANLFFRPERFVGLQAGVAYYRDEFVLDGSQRLRESIASAHLAWTSETPELIVEFATVEHEDRTTGHTFRSEAYYGQFGYRLPGMQEQLKPYLRYEAVSVDRDDPVFTTPLDFERLLVGLRWDFSFPAILKLEVQQDQAENRETEEAFLAQIAVTF